MGKLLKVLPVLLVLVLGALGGDWLHRKGAGVPPDADDPAAEEGAETAPAPGPAPETVSVPLPEQFFVPIVRNGSLRSVMVLSLGLEVVEARLEAVRGREFQLRDAMLRALMIHANTGGFDGNFTAEPRLDLLGTILLEAAQRVSGEDVRRVLVGDIARQEQ